jgi:hypothetical protein
MTNASRIYLQTIYNRFSLLGTWMPNSTVALGDVGVLEGGLFKHLTSLKSLGIPFKVRPGASAVDFALTSESGVEMQTKSGAELSPSAAPLAADIGLSIQFSREGGFVFQAVDCFVDEVDDKVRMGRAIVELYRVGKWEKQWGVVDTLVRTGAATIVVSNSSKATLELSANVPIQASCLARANSGLTVKSQSGDIVRFITQQGLTPLFRLSRVKPSMFEKVFGGGGRIRFGGAASDNSSSTYESFFDSVNPD